jgi:hypothetical protein
MTDSMGQKPGQDDDAGGLAAPGPSAAPPTSPGVVTALKPASTWPMVVGIIAVVLGGFGILGGIWGIVAPLIMGRMFAAASQDVQMIDPAIGLPLAVLGLALACMLAAGGIGLLRRRRWAVPVLLWWSWLKVVFSTASLLITIPVTLKAVDAAGANSPMPMMPIIMASLVLGLLWAWALPVFIIIWFRRGVIRGEVAGWS